MVTTTCPYCGVGCGLDLHIKDDYIYRVTSDFNNVVNQGNLCVKGRFGYDYIYSDRRITSPMIRKEPQEAGKRVQAFDVKDWVEVSWDEALDYVAKRLVKIHQRDGANALAVYCCAKASNEDNYLLQKLFRSVFRTNNVDHCTRLCHAGSVVALQMAIGSAAMSNTAAEVIKSDCFIVTGSNTPENHPIIALQMKAAVEKHGAKLIVIDPKRTRIAEQADLFIQIQPGTDVILALAMASELERCGGHNMEFIDRWVDGYEAYMENARTYTPEMVSEICGIDFKTFSQFSEWYKAGNIVSVSVGNGPERGHSGGSGIRSAMALQALTGNHGKLGAGVFAKPGNSFPKSTLRLERPDLVPYGTRTINIVDTSKVLLDKSMVPPIKAVFIYNHNPVVTHPDQNRMRRALAQEDLFIAGSDVVMTDSMAYCDVVLPAASHFEFPDIYGSYGHHYLQRAEPVIPRVGESLPNTEIFRRLAARFGFDDQIFHETDAELMDAAFIEGDPRLNGYKPSELPLEEALAMSTKDGEDMILCDTVFPDTQSGKIELFSQDLEDRFGYGLPRFEPVERIYPLSIISPSSSKRTNATFGGCSLSDGQEEVEINPLDAEIRGISDGDNVKVHNERGETLLIARITNAVLPGVLYTPKGTWLSASKSGQTVNALLDADIRTDIEDGACCNEAFCEVSRIN